MHLAIIGGGVAGLTAGYLCSQRHQVTLFEANARLGGNAYAYRTRGGDDVDLAVAVFGHAGYPNFYRLLARLGVATRRCPTSYVSFQDLDRGRGLYLTPGLRGLIAQRFAMLRPRQLAVLVRVFLGLRRARRDLAAGRLDDLTVAEALAALPELTGESRVVFLSMLCLLSSMSGQEVLAAPARFFLEKLAVHHDMLSPRALWSVCAMAKTTRSYVDALAAPFADHVHLGTEVQQVRRSPDGVAVALADGRVEAFDAVVLACSADQALRLLAAPSPDERRLLGAWRYKDGRVVVHRDLAAFPKRELVEAYTFLYTDRDGAFDTSVTGCLWRLPGVSRRCDLVSTQHPNFPIRGDLVELETVLRTPIFAAASCRTQAELPTLNGADRTYFCGSYFGYGLHEDAVTSAIAVAHALGAEL